MFCDSSPPSLTTAPRASLPPRYQLPPACVKQSWQRELQERGAESAQAVPNVTKVREIHGPEGSLTPGQTTWILTATPHPIIAGRRLGAAATQANAKSADDAADLHGAAGGDGGRAVKRLTIPDNVEKAQKLLEGPLQPLVRYLRAWGLESWIPMCEEEELDCDAWALMVS